MLLLVLAATVGLTALISGHHPGGDAGARRALLNYQERLVPLVQEWGKIEVQGMRPAIADLRSGPDPTSDDSVPPEAIGGEARAWQAGLKSLRVKIARLPAPSALARTKALLDRAIARYIEAAVEFEKAAIGPVESRSTGIDKGIDAASDGARIYNDASVLLQRARHSVGLSDTDAFPNHPAGESSVSP
ncbi:MAG: hypothetical protein QOK43_883 [Acidimicrobiaceae bacterium]|nr:hypothetical protein [Acidimicrobiaceae bacterium]